MKQTTLFRAAVIIHTLTSLFSIAVAMPALLGGPDAQALMAGVPQFVIVLSALLGVAGLLSAYGAWQGQRWGIGLTIFIQAVSGLLALPGILDGPTLYLKTTALLGVSSAIFVIVVMLRSMRPEKRA